MLALADDESTLLHFCSRTLPAWAYSAFSRRSKDHLRGFGSCLPGLFHSVRDGFQLHSHGLESLSIQSVTGPDRSHKNAISESAERNPPDYRPDGPLATAR